MPHIENINIRQIIPKAIEQHGIIVDVRDQESFAEEHIPMAINLPYEQVVQGRVKLPKGRVLILYCDSGVNSLKAAQLLAKQGYQVINTLGGMEQYR